MLSIGTRVRVVKNRFDMPSAKMLSIGTRVRVVKNRFEMPSSKLIGATGIIVAFSEPDHMTRSAVRVRLDPGTFMSDYAGDVRYATTNGVWFYWSELAPLLDPDADDNCVGA